MIGNVAANTSLSAKHDQISLYVPLQFFFSKNDGLSLPLIALQYHDVRLSFEFKRLQDCVLYTSNVDPIVDLASLKMLDASVYVDYIYLDTEERKRFAQSAHEYLIEQLQFTGEESVSQVNQRFKLTFNHPTKALF